MKILVTGSTGYLGSNLTRRLVRDGHEVRTFARKNSPNLKNLDDLDVEMAYGDLTDEESIKNAIKNINVVFHIGAIYREAKVKEQYYFDVNAEGTRRMLEASLKGGVEHFIHCSTIGVLGGPKVLPANEDSPYNPGDPYQRSKVEGEKIALEFHKKNSLPVTVIRPGAIYGPGDLRMLKMFRMIANRRFIMLGSGNAYLHQVYIDDLVDGFLLGWKKKNSIGNVYIIEGPDYVTLNELAAIIAAEFNVPSPKLHLPAKPFQILGTITEKIFIPLGLEPPIYRRRVDFFTKSRAFDISKARKELGYDPKFDIRKGVHETAKWYREKGYI
ncbi:MAG: NAD-dependent epimerase/dehydratase family protein [Actinobacteria bacterium]|nr:NAD-dependent epimerase/dehydratase family protein [Actinomycetota bacterium]